MIKRLVWLGAAAGALLSCGPVFAACTIPFGAIMSVTGSLGVLGQPIAKTVQLAVDNVNAAGGVNGCQLDLHMLDDQTNPTVSVDDAKKLIDISHVPVIVGPLTSGATQAVMTSVAAPSKVVLITPSATSPVFTKLAKEGKFGGWFFRTAPSDALQGAALAKAAWDKGYRKVAILALNSSYGEGQGGAFAAGFKKLGGTITNTVFYDASQSSYRSEVTKAMSPTPDAVLIIGYPGDGTLLTREWIAAGGTQNLLTTEGLKSESYIKDVGPQYFQKLVATAPGNVSTASTKPFDEAYAAKYGKVSTSPFVPNAYDAVVVAALAMEEAKSDKPDAIRDAIRKVTATGGVEVDAGVAGLKKARELLAKGKKIRYIGASGPLQFDKWGDVQDPMITWGVTPDGKIKTTGEISIADLHKLVSEGE
ncbi:MAG TPA: ABC transporter substrate-binding protein [Nevskiaceae bacterium]